MYGVCSVTGGNHQIVCCERVQSRGVTCRQIGVQLCVGFQERGDGYLDELPRRQHVRVQLSIQRNVLAVDELELAFELNDLCTAAFRIDLARYLRRTKTTSLFYTLATVVKTDRKW